MRLQDCSLIQKKELFFIIQKTLIFNESLSWGDSVKNVSLVSTIEELIKIYILRSQVYKKLNYDKEFPDAISGLNFDEYDEYSAIIFTKINGIITGTCRVIFDKDNTLPIDKNFSLGYLRQRNKKLAELSRLVVKNEKKGLQQEFKYLTKGAYLVMKKNEFSTLISVMVKEHFSLYDKFGGFKIEDEIKSYGSLGLPFIITSWEVSEITHFFKKVFLSH